MAELRYSTEEVQEALEKPFGVKAAAARRLGCTRQTVDNYIARYPDLEEVVEYQRDMLADAVELALMKRIQQGSDSAIKYVLSCFGRSRGWGGGRGDERRRLAEEPEPAPLMEYPAQGCFARRRDDARPEKVGPVKLTSDDDEEPDKG